MRRRKLKRKVEKSFVRLRNSQAKEASESAIEKVKKAGGEIILKE